MSNGAFGDGTGTGVVSRRRCSSSSGVMIGVAEGLAGVSCGEDPRGNGRNLGDGEVVGVSCGCSCNRGKRGDKELKDADKGVEIDDRYAVYACCIEGEILTSALMANLSS